MARKDLSEILGSKESETPSYQEGAKGLKGVAKGAFKGLASTIEGGSRLFGSAVAKGFDVVGMDKAAESMRGDFEAGKEFSETKLKPVGAAEKLGFGVEQFAEFFAPAGLALKATKAIKGAQMLKNLPKGYRTAATLLGISGAEGLSFASVTAAQEGEFNKEVGTSFLYGAAFPLALAGGGALARTASKTTVAQNAIKAAAASKPLKAFNTYLKEKLAPHMINTIIKPRNSDYVFSKAKPGEILRNPGKVLIDEGIVANSVEQLLTKAASKRKFIGRELGGKLKKIKTRIDTRNLLPMLDDMIAKAEGGFGNEAVLKELSTMRQRVTHSVKYVDGKAVLIPNKSFKFSAEKAHEIKKLIGHQTNWSKDAAENAANEVRIKVYRGLDDMIQSAAEKDGVKGVKKLQLRWGNLLTVEKATERTVVRTAKNRIVGLTDVFALTGGGLTFGAFGPASFAPYVGKKILEHPGFRTRAAKYLSRPEKLTQLTKNLKLGGYANTENIEKTVRAMFVGMSRQPSQN